MTHPAPPNPLTNARVAPSRRGIARMRAVFLLAVLAGATAPSLAAAPPLPDPQPHAQSISRGDAARPDLRVALTVSTTELTVADHVVVRLDADAPLGWQITLPAAPKSLPGWRVIRASTSRSDTAMPGRTLESLVLVLEPFLPGAKTLPPMSVTAANPAASIPAAEASTREVQFNVVQLIQNASELKPPELQGALAIDLPPEQQSRLAWILGSLAAVCVAIAFILGLRTRIGRTPPAPSPAETALRVLEQLAQPDTSRNPSTPQPTFSDIGIHVRTVLQDRLNLPARSLTTRELDQLLADYTGVSAQCRSSARSLLRELDQWQFNPHSSATASITEVATRAVDLCRSLPAPEGSRT